MDAEGYLNVMGHSKDMVIRRVAAFLQQRKADYTGR